MCAGLVRDGLQVRGDLAVVETWFVGVGGIIVATPARGDQRLEHVEALSGGVEGRRGGVGFTKWRCGAAWVELCSVCRCRGQAAEWRSGLVVSEGLVLFGISVRRGHAVAHNHGVEGGLSRCDRSDCELTWTRQETNVLPTRCRSIRPCLKARQGSGLSSSGCSDFW